MLLTLTRNWHVLALRGVLLTLFGLLAIAFPVPTAAALVALFAVYALIDGGMSIVGAVAARDLPHRTLFGLMGLVSIAAGIVAFVLPTVVAFTLYTCIAVWAIFRGVIALTAAISIREVGASAVVLAMSGVAAIVFGGLLLAQPLIGFLSLIWLIGISAIVTGALECVAAYRIHEIREHRVIDIYPEPAAVREEEQTISRF